MSRPKKERLVRRPPVYSEFKPAGVMRSSLKQIILELDELEALRLADYLGMDHSEAAEEMEISRSTFTRLVDKARKKVAAFLIEGANLSIEGGNVHFRRNLIKCHDCGHMFNTGFDVEVTSCPSCGSGNLIDLAGGFGHGVCCRGHNRRGRR